MGAPAIVGLSRKCVALWALGGVLLLLAQALVRLAPLAWEPVRAGSLTVPLAALYVGWSVANGYFEGYRGFHLNFVPRVVRRTENLLDEPSTLRVLLAPLYVMGFFAATAREKRIAWGVTALVWAAIALVRNIPQPWRGIIDAGVVVGLLVGALSLMAQGARLFAQDISEDASPRRSLN